MTAYRDRMQAGDYEPPKRRGRPPNPERQKTTTKRQTAKRATKRKA